MDVANDACAVVQDCAQCPCLPHASWHFEQRVRRDAAALTFAQHCFPPNARNVQQHNSGPQAAVKLKYAMSSP